MDALTTHQLQVERRERHRANQVYGDYWEAMIDKGQWREFGQDTGVTPLLFTISAMGFLMTIESQDLGLTSHPKDGIKYNVCLLFWTPLTLIVWTKMVEISFKISCFPQKKGSVHTAGLC